MQHESFEERLDTRWLNRQRENHSDSYTGWVDNTAFDQFLERKPPARKIRPLTGQVLIEVLPPDTKSAGGIDLPPSVHLSADEIQEQSHDPEKPTRPNIGVVKAIGRWPRLKNGMVVLPEFGIGAKVAFNPFRGTELRYASTPLRMIAVSDVMAVLG